MRFSPYLVKMNARINQLVKSLLQKDSIEQCSLYELQQFADRHPYFGAAQLLLTKKLQEEKSDQFDDQLQKTYLFFHNPLWVEHLLNDTGTADIKAAPKKEPPPPVVEDIVAVSVLTETNVPEPEPEVQVFSEATAEPPQAIVEEIKQPEPEMPVFTASIATETIEMAVEHTEEPLMNIPALKIEAIDPAKAELIFEPYHTVDYFASQGINFKEESKPKDKFGLQLKSFTDWLKTMKRLPVSEISKNADPTADHKVEVLAEHSLEEREVVTEAMAEVWEKQGNSSKAIDIYNKLSLLEPAKSPYFAAKIEELKKLN